MALDTANKRRSVLGLAMPPRLLPPIPDGATHGSADRRHLAYCYGGSGMIAGQSVSWQLVWDEDPIRQRGQITKLNAALRDLRRELNAIKEAL